MIRAKSRVLRWIASLCWASFGVTSFWIAWTAGLVSEEAWLKNTVETRYRSRPDRSRAATVLSKVGGSALPAMASTSASCSAMPRSKAGA